MRHVLPGLIGLCALALTACVTDQQAGATPPTRTSSSAQKPLVIRNDHGGNVAENILRRESLARSGQRVQIRGFCDSACTIYTTLPNACLGPKATFGFHAASFTGTNTKAPMMDSLIGRYYRNGIKKKWETSWSKSTRIHRITAKQYVRLDPQAKICGK